MLALLSTILFAVAPASVLRVRIVDPNGKPCADVPLAIRSAFVGGTVPEAASKTNTDGIAEFADAERWFTEKARAQIPQVVADVPFTAECSLPLLQREVPKDALTLALPPTGSIVAHLTKPGKPVGGQGLGDAVSELDLEWNDPGLGITRSVAGVPRTGTKDCVSFAHVGVGIEVRVAVHLTDGRIVAAGTLHALRAAGEEIAIEVGDGESMLTVSGRALDASSKPIPNAVIGYTAAGQPHSTLTDGDGGFHIDLARPRREGDSANEWMRPFEATWYGEPSLNLAWSPKGGDPTASDVLRATFALVGRRIDSSDLNLGDVKFATPTVLAQGLVRDADGNPLKDANVRVVQRLEAIGPANGAPNNAENGAAAGARYAEWRAVPSGSARSTSSGGFILRERADTRADATAALEVFSAKHAGAQCRSTLFLDFERDPLLPVLVELPAPGTTTETNVLLPRGMDVHGKLELDPGIDPHVLDITITYRTPTALEECLMQQNTGGRGPGPARIDKGGAFFWRMLPPGVIDLRIEKKGAAKPLLDLKGFDLANETTALNETLQEIDLRGQIH